MEIAIGDWGLRLGIKIIIFEFGYLASGIRIKDWDWLLLGLGLEIGIMIGIANWSWKFA